MCSKRWAKPVRPGFSSLEPTSVPDVDCHDGRLVVFVKNDRQAVGKRVFFDLEHGDLGFPRLVGRRHGRRNAASPHARRIMHARPSKRCRESSIA